MRFAAGQIDAFRRLSGDANPLHLDATYAGRTSFGQPVVYGIAQTLVALGTMASGRSLRLRRLRGTFRRPVFLGLDYELTVRETADRTVLRWSLGGVAHTDIVVTFTDRAAEDPSAPEASFVARREARDDDAPIPTSLVYDVDLQGGLAPLGLGGGELPTDQIRTLAGLSYLVGMEKPGRQALFATLDVTFPEHDEASATPYFQELVADHDDRFDRTRIRGRTRSGATFEVGAFVRARPADASIDTIAAQLESTGLRSAFASRGVVVTGSSRGFGAALAKAFAAAGARVVVHYRAQQASAAAVVAEAASFGTASALEADLASDDGASRFGAGAIAALGGAPDVLVLNATPPIDASAVHELRASALAAFVARSLAVVHGPLRELVPQMKPGSIVVAISSVYAVDRPAGFGHYVAAKSAIEALVAVMAKEHPAVRFVVARPPRMLTDQTNVVGGDRTRLASPADVAVRLLAALRTDASVVDL